MKTKISIALIAIIITVGSIYYFLSSKFIEPPIPKSNTTIVGTWKIDSVYNIKDSSNLSLLIAYVYKDSSTFKFNIDSSLQVISAKEIETQNYYVHRDSLFIKQDSTYSLHLLNFINDSCFTATNKDSTVIIFSKK